MVDGTSTNVNVSRHCQKRNRCHNVCMARELVRVLSTPSILEGEIVKSRLEDEGIPVLLKGGGNDPYAAGAAHVFVPADYEVQARLVLETVGERTEKPEGS
jgi:Putative prokaryotic signal transducing protein